MIFIDTGAFLARYLRNDQYHSRAIKIWKSLEKQNCVTSHHVLDETFTLLARRASYGFAAARAKNIYHSQRLRILRSDYEDEMLALEIFEKYADQEVSFTDALSFALMRQHQIHNVFSFDSHFKIVGFKVLS